MLVIGILFISIGFLGCFVHRIPGAAISFLGILALHFGTSVNFSTQALIFVGLLTVAATLLARYIPTIVSRIHKIGKAGKWGSIIGSLSGLALIASAGIEANLNMQILLYLTSFVILPFSLSFIFELICQKNLKEALRTALASYLSYLLGTLLNLGICCYGVYVAFMK